jgi:PAS domain S-box-containing protein
MATMGGDFERRFFELSIDMLCVLDFSGHFKKLNKAWETTLGFTRDELMAKRFIEFVHPDDRERTMQQNGSVRGGGQARLFENRYLCKDGSFRWLLWNSTPDFTRGVIYGVARDITAGKQAEEEINRLRSFLPICVYCKNVRDDHNYWQSVEAYIATHTRTQLSHGICPSCYSRVVEPQLNESSS